MQLTRRPRRLRELKTLRPMLQETHLQADDLVLPVFVNDLNNGKEPINAMPEVYRWSLSSLIDQIETWYDSGLKAFALFPCISEQKKCPKGLESQNENSISYQAARKIKEHFKDIILIADLALDPFTSHGHDGILNQCGIVDNDQTVELLCGSAALAADAGFDIVAPSDMMDGRVAQIRKTLDERNHENVAILSYSAKFCSAYYGPFREAISSNQSNPIDKSGYQLDPCNYNEAKLELALDMNEGADMLMIKPAEPYLDIIRYAKDNFNVPIAAYQVSGEYSRLWAASMKGWLDLEDCARESLISIKRAGADLILTYFAERFSKLI